MSLKKKEYQEDKTHLQHAIVLVVDDVVFHY